MSRNETTVCKRVYISSSLNRKTQVCVGRLVLLTSSATVVCCVVMGAVLKISVCYVKAKNALCVLSRS